MNLNLSNPPRLTGDTADQLRQITSYLYQLQRDLNVALDSVDSVVKEAAGENGGNSRGTDGIRDGQEPEKPDYQDGGRDPAGNGHLDANAGRDLSGYFRLRHLSGRSQPRDHSHRHRNRQNC